MSLTMEQKQKFYDLNQEKIVSAAEKYISRYYLKTGKVPKEDMYQQAKMAYIEYLNLCDTEDDVVMFPWWKLMESLRDLVYLYQPWSLPKRHDKKLSEFSREMPATVSLDCLRDIGIDISDEDCRGCIDVNSFVSGWQKYVIFNIDFDKFMETQSDSMKNIIAMYRAGFNQHEIAEYLNVSESAVSQRMKNWRAAYQKYMEGAKNA